MNNGMSNKPTFRDLTGMQKIEQQKNEEELKKIMADKYYDPTIGKNPLKDKTTKETEKLLPTYKNENSISKNHGEVSEDLNKILDVFENPGYFDLEEQVDEDFIDSYSLNSLPKQENIDDTVYSSKDVEEYLQTQDNIDYYNDKKGVFENNTDIFDLKIKRKEKINKEKEIAEQIKKENEIAKKELKEKPEYSEFERIVLKQTVYNYIEGKEQFVDDKKLSKEQIIEAVDEFKQNFPGEFASMINRKLITSDFKWKKEVFKNKDILVSYYPNLERPKIKYVINLDKENGNKVKIENKVFVRSSVKSDGTVYKDENGVILVFCSAPKQNDKQQSNKQKVV